MIVLFGKKGCKLCDAAKEKLGIFGVDYRLVDLQEPAPEDWREINMSGARACYELTETLPWLNIDGKIVSYPEAMKILRASVVVPRAQDKDAALTICLSETAASAT